MLLFLCWLCYQLPVRGQMGCSCHRSFYSNDILNAYLWDQKMKGKKTAAVVHYCIAIWLFITTTEHFFYSSRNSFGWLTRRWKDRAASSRIDKQSIAQKWKKNIYISNSIISCCNHHFNLLAIVNQESVTLCWTGINSISNELILQEFYMPFL